MVTKTRVRCPCCGMMLDLDRLREVKDVELQVYEQSFGGRVPRALAEGYTHRHGTAGVMDYSEITDPDVIKEVKALFRKRLTAARSAVAT